MKQKSSMQGGVSILVILVVLMLTCFAVLAEMSAYSDYKLADKNIRWTKLVLSLETEANRRVGVLDATLRRVGPDVRNILENETRTSAAAAEGWTLSADSPTVASCTIDGPEGTHLRVELELTPDMAPPGTARYRVKTWRHWRDEFVYQNGLDIWDGE